MGEMCVIGPDTKKLTKPKAVLIVKFLTPQSLEDTTMQIYCTGLEPKRILGQGADLCILTAMKYTLPWAKSLYDIGVRVMSAADISRAILADFDSMKGGSVFDTTQADSLALRYQSAIFSEKGTIFDRCVIQSIVPELLPILNTMAKPCVAQCAQNRSKVKILRCKDFGVEDIFRKYYEHLSLTKIEFSALASTTRSKWKRVNSTNAKSDSLYKVNTLNAKALTESVIMTTLSARCLLLAVSALFSVLPPNSKCLLIILTFLRSLYKVNYYPGTFTMETSIFIFTGLRRGFSIHLSPPQATVWHAVSRPCVAYDNEHFSGKRRLQDRGFRKEYGESPLKATGFYAVRTSVIIKFVIACANRPVLEASSFWKRLLEAFEGAYESPLETTFDVKLPVTPSLAPPLSLKSITLKRFCDRMDFGIIIVFHCTTHPWNPTLAFQKTVATPTPNQASTVATVAL